MTAGSATITEGNALPTDLVTCTGLLNSEGRKDDRDTVLDNALGYQLLDANNEEVTADTARNTPEPTLLFPLPPSNPAGASGIRLTRSTAR